MDTISMFISTPNMGYLIACVFCVGMIVGAVVRMWGWGVRDLRVWAVVTLIYILGIQIILWGAGLHAVAMPRVLGTMLAVGALYWSGLGVGIYIVRREKVTSKKILEAWLECYDEVVNGNGSDGC